MKSPLAALAASFAFGVFLAHAERPTTPGVAIGLALAALCLLAGLCLLRAGKPRLSFLLGLAGFVCAGVAASALFQFRFPPNHVSHLESWGVDLRDPVRLEGRITSTPSHTPYGLQFDVDGERIASQGQARAVTGKVRLRVTAEKESDAASTLDYLHLRYGDSIRTLIRLRKPRIYRNPGSFDFRAWMESVEDLYWIGTVKDPMLIEKLPRPRSWGLAAGFEKMRQRLLESIDRLCPPWSARGRYGAVLKAVLWGDRSSLDSETIENFRKTGLYHLLVISGLHVGLLALLARSLLRRFPLGETARSALLFLFLLCYAALVEQRAPTLRATLMIFVYLLAGFLYRGHSALNAIGFAALVLLLHRPAWLFESGFQLSFAAALLIAGLAVPILERTTEPYRRALYRLDDTNLDGSLEPKQAQFRVETRAAVGWLRQRARPLERYPAAAAKALVGPTKVLLWTANMLLFSAVLQLGLLPLMAQTFHRVSFVGVALNALAIPVMTLLLAIALPTVVLGTLLPAVAVWPGKLLSLVMAGLFWLTDLPGLPAWLSYRVPAPPAWVAWAFALSLIVAAGALGRWRRMFWLGLAGAGIFASFIAIHPFAPRLPDGVLEVSALDCGQGDALFVVLPDRTTMLVDGGGSWFRTTREGTFQGRRWDPGEDIVSPYLWSRGMKKLDVVVLSHAHEDHLGGLGAVLRNFQVGEFWHGENASTPEYRTLLAEVRQRHIRERILAAGQLIERGGVHAQILWPPPQRHPSSQPSNDDSLVIRLTHGEASALLPGDISREVERELLASTAPLESKVLKVSHHGSKSSSSPAFLSRVAPRVALITAEFGGWGNLPSPETLDLLSARGTRTFRTDIDGAITVEMQGPRLAVQRQDALRTEFTTEVVAEAPADSGHSSVR